MVHVEVSKGSGSNTYPRSNIRCPGRILSGNTLFSPTTPIPTTTGLVRLH
ncbi:unnamed protein product [Arabidopsis halleri]